MGMKTQPPKSPRVDITCYASLALVPGARELDHDERAVKREQVSFDPCKGYCLRHCCLHVWAPEIGELRRQRNRWWSRTFFESSLAKA